MDLKTLLNWGSEIVFCLCGLVSFNAAWRGLQNERCRIGTFVFWTILGLIFILGPYIPYALTGALLLVLGCLTATKQVQMGKFVPSEASFRKAQADKLGNKIFLPAITIGVVALALSMLKFSEKTPVISFPMLWGMIPAAVCVILAAVKGILARKLPSEEKKRAQRQAVQWAIAGGILVVITVILAQLKFKVAEGGVTFPSALAIGLASILAYLIGVAITRPKFAETRDDTARLLMTVGAASLLPQLLGALGSVFTEAGVGAVISSIMANVVPQGSVVLGVIVYVAGMVLFTMVMGNAFAAFSVITVGIGVPFVILQGGDPAIVGALGMTAGFCGTLMTPMAANFNIVPAAVLETKNKYTVIKAQLPMALIMIVVHVVLMLVLAF